MTIFYLNTFVFILEMKMLGKKIVKNLRLVYMNDKKIYFFQVNDPKHFRVLRPVLCHTRVRLKSKSNQ